MADCLHHNLLLLSTPKTRLRCRHCHLTITKQELGGSHCPECYAVNHVKRFDFESVEEGAAAVVRYRCEDCGALIDG